MTRDDEAGSSLSTAQQAGITLGLALAVWMITDSAAIGLGIGLVLFGGLRYRARGTSKSDTDVEQHTEKITESTDLGQERTDTHGGEPNEGQPLEQPYRKRIRRGQRAGATIRARLEDRLTELPPEKARTPTADEKQAARQALTESRDHLANDAYEAALERANDGLKQVAAIEAQEGHGSDPAITELRTDLQAVRQSVERRQQVRKKLSEARERRETAERALSVGELAQAEAALTELDEMVEEMNGSAAAELKQASRSLEQQLAAAQATVRIDEQLASVENKIERVDHLIEDREYERGITRLEAAEAELDRAAELNRNEALGREAIIDSKRDRVATLLEEAAPRSGIIETVGEAEALVEQGIEYREANEPAAALESFETAKQQYESAAERCEANGLAETWEVNERHSMLESYVTVVQNELEDHRQAVHSSLEKQLETAADQVDRTTQHTEVEDYVSARETLGAAVLALDEATQLLERNQVEDEYHQRYDTLVAQAGQLHDQLPEQEEAGEYSTRVLVESLQELATKLTESPQPDFVNKYGEYPSEAYLEAFGSWPEALAAANLDAVDQAAHERRKYSRVEVLDALVECARKIGHPPDKGEMNKHGKMSASPVSNRFADWDAALAVAGLGDGEVPPEPEAPEPNELAELYDILKTLSMMLEEYPEADDHHQPNSGSPLAEWQAALESRWTGDGTPGRPVYGLQQAKRNSFSMSDYRSAYGNGSRVTEFLTIETEPLSDQARQRLIEYEVIEPDEPLRVPVSPETKTALQLFVESEETLTNACSLLDEFPAFPAADLSPSVLEPETADEGNAREDDHGESESNTTTTGQEAGQQSVSENSSEMITKLLGDMGFNDSKRETADD